MPKIALAVSVSAALLSMAACGSSGGNPLSTGSSSSSGGAGSGGVTVGSADFPESALLAEIYAGALEAKGIKVTKKLNIGAREAYIPALQDGSIDLIPEYTGVLTQYFNKNAKATDADGVYAELKASLPATLTVLDKSAAEDKDALVMKKSRADQLGVKSIADLAGKCQTARRRRPAGVEDAPDRPARLQGDLRADVQGVPPARRRWPADAQRPQERPDRRR